MRLPTAIGTYLAWTNYQPDIVGEPNLHYPESQAKSRSSQTDVFQREACGILDIELGSEYYRLQLKKERRLGKMSEENKTVVRRFYEEAWGGNLSLVDEICAPDYVHIVGGRRFQDGIQHLKDLIAQRRAAFPDLQCTIKDQITEGGQVVVQLRWRGTHQGQLTGNGWSVAPTNKQLEWLETHILLVTDGKIAERCDSGGLINMTRQLRITLEA